MYGLAMGRGGGHLGTMGACVRVGMEGQSVPQRNRERSIMCRLSIHPQPSLRWSTITGPSVGLLDAVAACALEWWHGQRLSTSLLGWGVIDNADIKRLLGVVNDGRGIVNNLIEEASQVWFTDDLQRAPNANAKQKKQKKPKGRGEGACEN